MTVVHLDDYFYRDPGLAPTVPSTGVPGTRIVDFSDPRSIDTGRLCEALARHSETDLLVVEGTFALALPELHRQAAVRAYVDVPPDIRLARKVLRKLEDAAADPQASVRGYLARGRQAHAEHVEPTRARADIVLDGTRSPQALVEDLATFIDLRGPRPPLRPARKARDTSGDGLRPT
ncbi:Uridine kinase [Streptomyces sp. YIM 130001]|uniref:uridine kinase family protein n=1 Tax=Streptomyces sp. YIM 130001 TaxID=2259644 RepID=UPI000EDB12C4|nr:Uridine kinase [Streptomyces sp. YIM 130001]